VRGEDVLDHLAQLVNQSLVVVEDQDALGRYRVLETVRQFAADQLDRAGEARAVRDRHLDWYLELAERADGDLIGPRQTTWLEVLEREHDNVRAALRWSLESGAIEKTLRLAVACSYFWQIRGHRYRTEGRRWLEDALAAPAITTTTVPARARALYWAGTFAGEQLDFGTATAHLEASLHLWRELDNAGGIAEVQLGLGIVLRDTGDYAAAERLLQQSLVCARRLCDQLKIARILRYLGSIAVRQGQGEAAAAMFHQSLAVLRALGETHLEGHVLDHLGEAELARGAIEPALQAHRRAVELLQAAGCLEGANTSLYLQGRLAQARGQSDVALALAARSLRGYRVLGNPRDLPDCLELVAESIAERHAARGAELFGAADTLRETIRLPLSPRSRAVYDAGVAAARRALGDAAFDAARAAGRALANEAAIDLAIECADQVRSAVATGPLTAREAEVVKLVGRGLSNKEIAGELVVSVRTAEAHITSALNKLGLRSRAQLAVWAAEHRLLAAG
jgi:DNA-binding CsgD family transcriptional regulator